MKPIHTRNVTSNLIGCPTYSGTANQDETQNMALGPQVSKGHAAKLDPGYTYCLIEMSEIIVTSKFTRHILQQMTLGLKGTVQLGLFSVYPIFHFISIESNMGSIWEIPGLVVKQLSVSFTLSSPHISQHR